MYLDIYNLIVNCFYGSITITGWMEMTATVLATACTVFAFIIPFLIVWKVIKIICGR